MRRFLKTSKAITISLGMTMLASAAQAQNCDATLAPKLKQMSEQGSFLTEEQAVLDAYTKSYNEAVAAKRDTYSDAVRMRMLTFSGCSQLSVTKDLIESIVATTNSSTCAAKPQAMKDAMVKNAEIMKNAHAQCLAGLEQVKGGIAQLKAEGKK